MAASAVACASSALPPCSSSSSSSSSSSPTPHPISKHARVPNTSLNPNSPLSMSSSPHDPSLRFANLLWFKGTYNTQVFVGETEPADSVVKRFRRAVMQAGIITECRRRRFFETPQDIVKRKRQAAQRRKSRTPFFSRALSEQRKDANKAAAATEDDNDNWEYDEIAGGL